MHEKEVSKARIFELKERVFETFSDVAYKFKVWEVGFSGGKDSTTLLHLLVEYLLERYGPKPNAVYIIFEDTLLEYPRTYDWVYRVLDSLSNSNIGDITTLTIIEKTPRLNESFFVQMIEQGYPPPHFRFRWCTRVLKLKPMREVINWIKAKHGSQVLMVTAERKEESNERSRVMKKRTRNTNRRTMLMPIQEWTTEEVLSFLKHEKQPWTDYSRDYRELLHLYFVDEGLYRNVRYGCWCCTVIKHDKSLELWANIRSDKCAKKALEIKRKILEVGRDVRYRVRGYGTRLNTEGRKRVAEIVKEALEEAPYLFKSYFRHASHLEKTKRTIKSVLKYL